MPSGATVASPSTLGQGLHAASPWGWRPLRMSQCPVSAPCSALKVVAGALGPLTCLQMQQDKGQVCLFDPGGSDWGCPGRGIKGGPRPLGLGWTEREKLHPRRRGQRGAQQTESPHGTLPARTEPLAS